MSLEEGKGGGEGGKQEEEEDLSSIGQRFVSDALARAAAPVERLTSAEALEIFPIAV